MTHARTTTCVLLSITLDACAGSASARLELSNETVVPSSRVAAVLADGTSLRVKLLAAYLAEDVDPATQDNLGPSAMIWLNPECAGDTSGCNVAGFALPQGPRVTQYFELARPTTEVNAELNSQDAAIEPGTYRYARIELCKAYGGQSQADIPTLMWKGPGMTVEQPFVSGDCGRTSLPFDPPLVIVAGDVVTISLGYDLAKAIVSGAPHTDAPHCSFSISGYDDPDGDAHCFRSCVDTTSDHRVCMDFPELSPSAARL